LIGEGLLFDTFGNPGVLAKNMRKFNIDPAKIKRIVLSHDDWDHVSGLWYLLEGRRDITVYICPGFNQGIKDRIVSFGARVIEVEPFMEIEEGVFSTGQVQGSSIGRSIFEQALAVKSSKHITIITGCAHPGIVNIVNIVRKHFSNEQVYFVLGGLHLKDSTNEISAGIIQELRDLGVCKAAPMHCTGKRATAAMREVFGYGFVQAKEGDVIEL